MTAAPDGKTAAAPTPWLAVLLTWVLPGAGHFYLGKLGWALGAFLVVEGLYALGVLLSGGMFLEYLPLEMRTPMAWVLTPEIGNFGALYWHQGKFGYGPPGMGPRPWPAAMDIGTTLTAASGVLNLLLASHAHFAARLAGGLRREPGEPGHPAARLGPTPAAVATFLLPGLGQVLQGRRLRGLLMFVALVGLFGIGTLLAEGSNLDRERHFYYWAGQFLLGLPAALTELAHGHARLTGFVPYADAGVVLACVAGMLNVMAMLDAYGYGEDRVLGRDPYHPRAGHDSAAEAVRAPGEAAARGEGTPSELEKAGEAT